MSPKITGLTITDNSITIDYTPDPPPIIYDKLNVGGYWGSSGSANDSIPLIKDINPLYNILILTFLNFTPLTDLLLYQNNSSLSKTCSARYGPTFGDGNDAFTDKTIQKNENFYKDIQSFKNMKDPLNRKRYVMVSMGGRHGQPFLKNSDNAYNYLKSFLLMYKIDGIDIDMESGGFGNIDSMTNVLSKLKNDNYLISAVPEPTNITLTPYINILKYLDWIWPQFYNNPPPGVDTTYYPPCYGGNGDDIKSYQSEYTIEKKDPNDCTNCWAAGSIGPCMGANTICYNKDPNGKCPSDSKLCPLNPDSKNQQCVSYNSGQQKWPWWAGVVDNIILLANKKGNLNIERGITTLSCNDCKAGSTLGGTYDYDLLRTQIVNTKTKFIATWAIAYDITQNYKWVKTITGQ
jgi:hypothetical protein